MTNLNTDHYGLKVRVSTDTRMFVLAVELNDTLTHGKSRTDIALRDAN